MACSDCSDISELNPCECESGKNAFTLTTAALANITTTSFTLAVSNVDPYSGAWARPGQIVFVEGFGYYEVNSTSNGTPSTVMYLKNPASPFTGGAAFSPNSVDYQNFNSTTGTIPSGTKISPGGVKGSTGATAVPATLEGVFHGATTTYDINPASTSYLTLATENIAASALIDVGDSLRIQASYYFYQDPSSTALGNIKILFGGVSITEFSSIEPSMYDLFPYVEVESIVSRVDNVTIDVRTFLKYAGKGASNYSTEYVASSTGSNYTTYQIIGATVSALTNATTVLLQGKVGNTNDRVKLGYYLIENLQKI